MSRRTISFPISTYVDFKTAPTTLDSQNLPQPYGVISKISVDPAQVLTHGNSPDLTAFVRHFRRWKYSGTKVSVVPVARAPVDPAHMTYSASMPSIDPFDIMLFHAWKRWTNRPQTVPVTGLDSYFLMDKTWKKTSVLRGFSMFCRPRVSNLGYTVPTNPFTLTGGPTTDFDPTHLHMQYTGLGYVTNTGSTTERVEPYTTTGSLTDQPVTVQYATDNANIDGHRHNLEQINDGSVDRSAGMIRCQIDTENSSITDKLKSALGLESVTTTTASIRPFSRYSCRVQAGSVSPPPSERVGVDQANLTGQVATYAKEPNRPEGSPSSVSNWGTTTGHIHQVNVPQYAQLGLAMSHLHQLDADAVGQMAEGHRHVLNMAAIAPGATFTYDAPNQMSLGDGTHEPVNVAPWWQADTHAVTVGTRRMSGWQDTRVVDFGGTGVSTNLRSATFPLLLWRIPSHWHTQYTFRLWQKHYFALSSPITHEIYSGSNLAADLADQYETELRKPSISCGNIEVVNPAHQEWLDTILNRADEAYSVLEEEMTTV